MGFAVSMFGGYVMLRWFQAGYTVPVFAKTYLAQHVNLATGLFFVLFIPLAVYWVRRYNV
jgi:hypothetical protein